MTQDIGKARASTQRPFQQDSTKTTEIDRKVSERRTPKRCQSLCETLTIGLALTTQWARGTAAEANVVTRDALRRPHIHSDGTRHSAEHSRSAQVEGAATPLTSNRTIYYRAEMGLCNQLQGILSALHWAQDLQANLRLVRDPSALAANGWYDPDSTQIRVNFEKLFAYPRFEWVDSYPAVDMRLLNEVNGNGRTYHENGKVLSEGRLPYNCTVRYILSQEMARKTLPGGWETVGDENVLCLGGYMDFAKGGRNALAPLYGALQPTAKIDAEIERFKQSNRWDASNWVCVHIRRTDLHVASLGGVRVMAKDSIPLASYVDQLQRIIDPFKEHRGMSRNTRIFVASDDAGAVDFLKSQFAPGQVVAYEKTNWGRATLEGLEGAVRDLVLLSKCPVLVGTYYSSYSLTAGFMGNSYAYEVAPPELVAAESAERGAVHISSDG